MTEKTIAKPTLVELGVITVCVGRLAVQGITFDDITDGADEGDKRLIEAMLSEGIDGARAQELVAELEIPFRLFREHRRYQCSGED